jgi:hypothetical protein
MSVSIQLDRIDCLYILLLGLIFIPSSPALSQSEPELVIAIDSVEAWPGEQNIVLTVSMANYVDTVAEFGLWLILNRPDICEFVTNWDTLYDTTYWRCLEWSGPDCLDSMDITDSVLSDTGGSINYDWVIIDSIEAWIGSYDTAGTLLSGWEYISVRSIGDAGNNVLIDAKADLPGGITTPGIEPQEELTPLIKVYVDAFYIPDEWTDRKVEIIGQSDGFFDPFGNPVPPENIITDTIIDSSCFWCEYWEEPESTFCWSYIEVPCDTEGVSIDSVWCCDTTLHGYLDTSLVQYINGELRVRLHVCGDLNNDGEVNIFDVVTLISFIYEGYQDEYMYPISYWDIDGNGFINLFDIVHLISFLYLSGPPPICY